MSKSSDNNFKIELDYDEKNNSELYFKQSLHPIKYKVPIKYDKYLRTKPSVETLVIIA